MSFGKFDWKWSQFKHSRTGLVIKENWHFQSIWNIFTQQYFFLFSATPTHGCQILKTLFRCFKAVRFPATGFGSLAPDAIRQNPVARPGLGLNWQSCSNQFSNVPMRLKSKISLSSLVTRSENKYKRTRFDELTGLEWVISPLALCSW